MTAINPAPSQSNVQVALRAFLLSVLPGGVDVVEGQDNEVAEPSSNNFVVMTVTRRERISTNVDSFADCAFTASIAGTVMTVTAMQHGSIVIGRTLFGPNITSGTTVTAQTSGPPGGIGAYAVSISQAVSSETMATGAEALLQPTKICIQLDVHSALMSTASDMAQTISTLFRDEYATSFFAQSGFDVTPLYADDPKQIPFINGEGQYESRYVIDAELQANQVVQPGQQFASVIEVGLVDVDAVIPA